MKDEIRIIHALIRDVKEEIRRLDIRIDALENEWKKNADNKGKS